MAVIAQHLSDGVDLVIETFGEQRADRTVDQAADQSFLFGRAAFALEEAAGDTAGRRIFFLIVDGEREEILPVLHRLGGSDGAEHNRLAQARDDRAIGLAGNLARFERQRFAAPLDRYFFHIKHLVSFARRALCRAGPSVPGSPARAGRGVSSGEQTSELLSLMRL